MKREEIQEIFLTRYDTWGEQEEDMNRVLSHIDNLKAENEELKRLFPLYAAYYSDVEGTDYLTGDTPTYDSEAISVGDYRKIRKLAIGE